MANVMESWELLNQLNNNKPVKMEMFTGLCNHGNDLSSCMLCLYKHVLHSGFIVGSTIGEEK